MTSFLRRRWRSVLGAGVTLAGLVYGASFTVVLTESREDQARPADAIVVLGAAQYNGRPSPVLKSRLDHGLDLWRDRIATRIVVTGGIGEGDRMSEATVGQRYLLSRGVPDSEVVVLARGRTTDETMAAVAGWLNDKGLGSVVLVSDPFHMARLRLEARGHRVKAYTSPTRTSPISESPRDERRYLAAEAAKLPVVWVRSW
ncbi:MAG TPA: YdcF family protein [Gemmatimonadales bacterium]|nr:YdcF family protein [Gemmatimonadales bacterium]